MTEDTKNTFSDNDKAMSDTEVSRGIKVFSMTCPMCGGVDELQMIYKTTSDQMALDFFDMITSKIGLKMSIAAVRKGGGGP